MSRTDHCTLRDGTPLLLRPVGDQDAPQLERLVQSLSCRDRRWRFHGSVNGLTPHGLHLMTHPVAESLALLAIVRRPAGDEVVGDVRGVVDASGTEAEFGLMVAPGWRRLGVAEHCLAALRRAAAEQGLRWLYGSVLADNEPMLALIRRCGFQCTRCRHDPALFAVELCIEAAPATSRWPPTWLQIGRQLASWPEARSAWASHH